MAIERFNWFYSTSRYALLALVLFSFGCSSSDSTPDIDDPHESDPINGDSSVVEALQSTLWGLTEAADQQGRVFTLSDPIVYVLNFRDDGVYEHFVFCQPYRGTYQYQDSLLQISDGGISEVADCPASPVDDVELAAFLPDFYSERQLIVDLSDSELTLRGVNNDFLRYERCPDPCFVEF